MPIILPEKTDIIMRGDATATQTAIYCGFDIEIAKK